LNLNAHDFARLALGEHLKRAAADLAIGGKLLGGDAGIDRKFEGLPAERALDGFRNFHETMISQVRFVRKSRAKK
jgi:hypothetical protein